MKKIFVSLSLFISLAHTPIYAQTASCSYNANGEIVTDTSGYVDCVADTGEQKLKAQYLALCRETPTVSDYQSKCEALVNVPSGKDIVLSKGATVDLLDNQPISLPEGVYTHAVVRIDSELKMRGSYLFDKPLLGGAGGIGKLCWSATTGTTGTYSDTQDYQGYTSLNQLATQCGSAANAEFTLQDYKAFAGIGGFSNSITGRSSPSGPYELYTLKSVNELSSTNPLSLDGEYLLGIQAFTNPVIITPNLKSIDFGFKLENMFHIQSNWQSLTVAGDNPGRTSAGGGNKLPIQCIKDQSVGNSCFLYLKPMGFEFSVSVK